MLSKFTRLAGSLPRACELTRKIIRDPAPTGFVVGASLTTVYNGIVRAAERGLAMPTYRIHVMGLSKPVEVETDEEPEFHGPAAPIMTGRVSVGGRNDLQGSRMV
jgi:hypothetical protein